MVQLPKFPKLEEKILKFWKEKNIFKKTLEKDSPKGDFIFYEGPPTANGRPGIHHVLARAFKDAIPRFKTMQGYHVPRKAGWDTHGLPVELQVEKEIGISGKPDIEKFGVEEFNKKCKESVWIYKEEWEKLTERIAFWLDLENPYITYSNDYIETLWWIIKDIYKKGLLYSGYKVVPHCPRCGTSLSSHEVAQGYKEVEEESVFVKFKIKGEGNTYILSWTTTPWTLPGNVALAVGKDINYSKIKVKDEYYILATELIDEVIEDDYEIVDKMRGENLVGIEYEPLFPGAIDPGDKKAWYIATADFVTVDEGTGIVHIAVMYGVDDYDLGDQIDLPKVHTVDEEGKFMPSVTKWAGKFVKKPEVTKGIIKDLQDRNLLFKEMPYKHDYPFCWRCDTPLLYYAKNSWFIKMSALREDLIAENQKINWVPEHIKNGRFGEWLDGVKDWAISRERYWGTPIPIWRCEKCKELKVIGSYEELSKEAGIKIDDKFDPHKPFIDEIRLKCNSCGGEMRRTRAVMDCWFDAGSMPFAQDHYPFENKEKIDSGKGYPAEFISEAIDQTRGWFYTLLAIGVALGKGVSYKNVICLGHINDKEGKKMSKSKGNVIDPWKVINQYGADALRFHLYTINQPGEAKNFDIKDVGDVLRKNFIILWNVLSFYQMYAGENISRQIDKIGKSTNILDQWAISLLNKLIKDVTDDLENYHETEAARRISEFINDLSTWYVRRSRDRFKFEDQDKEAAVDTLYYSLLTLSKLLAPFTPIIAEAIYQELEGGKESVHIEDWPEIGEENNEVLDNMIKVRKLVESVLAARDEAGIKVRQPLGELYIAEKLGNEYLEILKDEVNIKEIIVVATDQLPKGDKWLEKEQLSLNIEITNELKKEGFIRELSRHISMLRKSGKLTIEDKVDLFYETADKLTIEAIEEYKEKLKKDTLCNNITAGKEQVEFESQPQVNDVDIWLGINKK